jgi:hypothetical protein
MPMLSPSRFGLPFVPYASFASDEAPRSAPLPGVLEYVYNNGGLNNQRMALLGLLLTALRDSTPVRLPYFHLKDQRTDSERVTPIGNVFDLDRIHHFAALHSLRVVQGAPAGNDLGWDYFRAFPAFVQAPASRASFRLALDGAACLQARLATHPEVLKLKEMLFRPGHIDTVVQLRIEADWQHHFQHRVRPVHGDGGDSNAGFARIIGKVRNTFPDLRRVLTTADEASMNDPKDVIREHCRRHFGIDLFWKTDFLPQRFLAELAPLDCSMIDFELSLASPRFVGTTLSTFANMAAFQKFAVTLRPVRGHYIYNSDAETVLERRDNGLCPPGTGPLEPNASDTLIAACGT